MKKSALMLVLLVLTGCTAMDKLAGMGSYLNKHLPLTTQQLSMCPQTPSMTQAVLGERQSS